MHILKLIGLTFLQLARQVLLLPEAIISTLQRKRRHTVENDLELERLDRIRNPSKYLGK